MKYQGTSNKTLRIESNIEYRQFFVLDHHFQLCFFNLFKGKGSSAPILKFRLGEHATPLVGYTPDMQRFYVMKRDKSNPKEYQKLRIYRVSKAGIKTNGTDNDYIDCSTYQNDDIIDIQFSYDGEIIGVLSNSFTLVFISIPLNSKIRSFLIKVSTPRDRYTPKFHFTLDSTAVLVSKVDGTIDLIYFRNKSQVDKTPYKPIRKFVTDILLFPRKLIMAIAVSDTLVMMYLPSYSN